MSRHLLAVNVYLLLTQLLYISIIIDHVCSTSSNSRILRAQYKIQDVTRPLGKTSSTLAISSVQVTESGNIYYLEHQSIENVITKYDRKLHQFKSIAPTCILRIAACNLFVTRESEEIYLVSAEQNKIFKIDWNSSICTVIVGTGNRGYSLEGSLAIEADLNSPCCIHVTNDGTIYIADSANNAIRIVKNGIITTLARFNMSISGVYVSKNMDVYMAVADRFVFKRFNTSQTDVHFAGDVTTYGGFGGDGGLAVNANFQFSTGKTSFLEVNGNLFLADTGNARIRVINLNSGIVETFAGIQDYNPQFNVNSNGDGGPAVNYRFYSMDSVLSYHDGFVYVADSLLGSIKRINIKTGIISIVIGKSDYTSVDGPYFDGLNAIDVDLQNPMAISLDLDENLIISEPDIGYLLNISKDGKMNIIFPEESKYFSDVFQPILQKIVSIANFGNTISVVSSSGYVQQIDSDLNSKMIGGPLSPSRFIVSNLETLILNSPKGLFVLDNILYISDSGSHRIIKIDFKKGIPELVAGNGSPGFRDGLAVTSQLDSPTGIHLSGESLYIADTNNHRIRIVNLTCGNISTIAGSGVLGFSGDYGDALLARLNAPTYVYEFNDQLYISDTNNNRIRRVNLKTNIITTVIGTGIMGYNDGDNGALFTHISLPKGLYVDELNCYFVDSGNQRLRYLQLYTDKIENELKKGLLKPLNYPSHYSIGKYGNGLLTDSKNHQVLQIDNIYISRLIGLGVQGNDFIVKNQHAINIKLNSPECTVYDPKWNKFYVSDTNNNRIIMIEDGYYLTVEKVIGNYGDGGKLENAQLQASSIAFSKSGEMFISENQQNRIRKVSTNGIISTIAGTGLFKETMDGKQANISSLASPNGLIILNDEIVFTEGGSNKVRKITKNGKLHTFAGNGVYGFSGDGDSATMCSLNEPTYIAASRTDLFITDSQNFRIRRVGLKDGIITTIAGNGEPSTMSYRGMGVATNHSISPGNLVVTSNNTVFFIDMGKRNVKKLTPFCPDGYYLQDYTNCLPFCFGKIDQIDSGICSGRGFCQLPNKCVCSNPLEYSGNECDIPVCFGISANSSLVCTNTTGTCIGPNTCQCSNGFIGNECQTPTCFGKAGDFACGGSSKGKCIGKDKCSCYPDFIGNECQGNPSFYIIIGVSIGGLVFLITISLLSILSISVLLRKYRNQKKILQTDGLIAEKLLSFSDQELSSHDISERDSLYIPLENLRLSDSIKKIGSGISSVFQTQWNGYPVAVKVYDLNNLEISEEQFLSESKFLASLRHPNIITFYGISTSATKRFIVMELMESSLQFVISELQRGNEVKSLKEKIAICINIASGVYYLHTLQPKKVIHRYVVV